MTTEKNMLDVFKSILQEGMEIDKVKEYNANYKFIMSYKGMTAKCQLAKVCALGCERQNCMNVINNAISSMYINAGDLKEAKAWLDGEKWGNEPNNDIGVRKIDGYIDKEKLKSFIEDKCYEILNQKDNYKNVLKNMQESAEKLSTDPHFYVGYIAQKSPELKKVYTEYRIMERDLSQFAHILGDEYVEIMNGILKNGGEQNE